MTLKAWQRDKAWADQYLPEATRIFLRNGARHVRYVEADAGLDRGYGTDYLAYADDLAIALRFRRPDVWSRDITLRSARANGVETELAKMLRGHHADVYLFGWTVAGPPYVFADFVLFDIPLMLRHLSPQLWREQGNRDGQSWFVARPWADLRAIPGCVIDFHRGAAEATYVNPRAPLRPHQLRLV